MNKKKLSPLVSVIIPAHNEEDYISGCLDSLSKQSYKKIEVIIVDDGSSDNTAKKVDFQIYPRVKLYKKGHSGPGESRNYGVEKSNGSILIFIDADMVLDSKFVENLCKPIILTQAGGTYTNEEYLANPNNYWARNWNLGRFVSCGNYSKDYQKMMIPYQVKTKAIFRAIKKSIFLDVGGYGSGGDYSDDASLVAKIDEPATLVKNAIIFHYNPASIYEVWEKARWVGSDSKLRSSIFVTTINLIKFSIPSSLLKAIIVSVKTGKFEFIPFKIVYDLAVWGAIISKL